MRYPHEMASQDELRERVFVLFLDRPLERPGAERRVEALLDEELDGLGADLQLDVLGAKAGFHLSEQDSHDVAHVVARERVEDDDVINSVEELRVERALELVLDGALDRGELLGAPSACLNPDGGRRLRSDAPEVEVMMITVFLKSTRRRELSVRPCRPGPGGAR
jgi:hypothetical protein